MTSSLAADNDQKMALTLPAGCTSVSWRVEAGASVRAGDVLGYCISGGGGAGASAASVGAGGGGKSNAGGTGGGGLIRPKKRARPRPKAAATAAAVTSSDKQQASGTSASTSTTAATAAVPRKKAGSLSLGSLVAGIGRTDSTLTGGSSTTGGTGTTNSSVAGDDGTTEEEETPRGGKANGTASTAGTGTGTPVNGGVPSSIPLKAPSDGFLRIAAGSSGSDPKGAEGGGVTIVGYVEPCHHPAVIDGLCAVCGSTVDRK